MQECDIVAPLLVGLEPAADRALREYYRSVQAEGKTMGGYQCGGGGLLRSPTTYYREAAWLAWRWGLTYLGTWSYMATDTMPGCWDTFIANDTFETVFFTPDEVTPSKQLAAWCEGIQDYECCRVLADLTAQRDKAGRHDAAYAQAIALLQYLADDANAPPRRPHVWQQETDDSGGTRRLDSLRMKVLMAIDRLTDEKAAPTGATTNSIN